jgi:hypothetical protein
MALAVTVSYIDAPAGSQFVHAYGTLTFSGSYATGGEAVTWQGLGTQGTQIPSSQAPTKVYVDGINGYYYQWVASTGKVKISTTAATELTATTYPAGVTGDAVTFEAIFLKLQ